MEQWNNIAEHGSVLWGERERGIYAAGEKWEKGDAKIVHMIPTPYDAVYGKVWIRRIEGTPYLHAPVKGQKTCKLFFSLKSLLYIWPTYVILNAYFAICTYDSRVCGEHGAKITLFRDIELPVIHLFRFCRRVPLPNKARKFQLFQTAFFSPVGNFICHDAIFLRKTKTQTTFWISLQ